MSVHTFSNHGHEDRASLVGVSLHDRVRKHIDQATAKQIRGVDRATVLRLLNAALASEIACVRRTRRNHYTYMMMASRSSGSGAAAECLEQASVEQLHADWLTLRILQLGGKPERDPAELDLPETVQAVELPDPVEMIRQDIEAERVIIDGYKEILRYLGDEDPITRGILMEILAAEEKHVTDLNGVHRTRSA